MSDMAIILAAGLGSRMRPLTESIPKPLIKVHGTPMIETVINSLAKRGVANYIVVVGYLGDQFAYLEKKYNNLKLVWNKDYRSVNNISSIYSVAEILVNTDKNVFICEADLYVSDERLFLEADLYQSGYFGKMVEGHSDDWVFDLDDRGRIIRVGKGGDDCYNMVGVSWFQAKDACALGKMVLTVYGTFVYQELFWDDVVNSNLDKLDLIVYRIKSNQITEIDTVDELLKVEQDITSPH